MKKEKAEAIVHFLVTKHGVKYRTDLTPGENLSTLTAVNTTTAPPPNFLNENFSKEH